MLNLSLTAVARGPVRVRGQIPPDDPVWDESGIQLARPLEVDLEARGVGEGVLVRGEIRTELAAECRRCLVGVPVEVRDSVDLLFEPLTAEDEAELGGEVYPLPDRGDILELDEALREQLLLRVPAYVECSESCRGLCPTCGAELNHVDCGCQPSSSAGPWDALKNIEFD